MPKEGSAQQLSERLNVHKASCKALVAERQALLQQQAGVLAGYVMAGAPLPGRPDASTADERRQQLVAQLTQEEGAARAALEALKQGSSLSKAREVGEKVMRQAQELAAAAGAAQAATGGEPIPAGTAAEQRRSVLLPAAGHTQPAAAAGHLGARGAWLPGVQLPASAAATANPTPVGRQGRVVFSTPAAAAREAGMSAAAGRWSPGGGDDGDGYDDDDGVSYSPPSRQQYSRQADRLGVVSSPTPQQQRMAAAAAAAAAGGGNTAGDVTNQQSAAPGYIQELKAQVAALQATLQAQLVPQAAANPWSQLMPAITAATMMANNPAAAAAMAAAGQQQAFAGVQAGFGGMQPGQMGGAGLPPGLASDPQLAAAAAAHARNMALLRMDVEHARGVAELQQIRAQLASLAAAASPAGHQQPLSSSLPDIMDTSRRGAGQQQLENVSSMELQQQHGVGESSGPHGGGAADDDDTASMLHKLSDADGWLDGLQAAGGAAPLLAPAAPGCDDEVLGPEEASSVLAARGSNADTDVLQVHVTTAGPFSRRGTYRVSVVLYEGYQPVEAAPGHCLAATTSKRHVTPQGTAAAAAVGDAADTSGEPGGGGVSLSSCPPGVARFNESLALKGLRLASSTVLVFEVYMAKPGLAGLPTKESLVAWAAAPLMMGGQVLPGVQSTPLFRLPLMLSAQRKFTFDGALLDFRLTHYRGAPGDVEREAAVSAGRAGGGGAGTGSTGSGSPEDIPGVPADAWVRVARGVPPADPYTPGDGLVVVVDGARFLPSSTTITKVVGSVWSSSGALLAGPFEGVAQPDSDALNPAYMCSATLGASHNNTRFEDATATLMLQVQTIERTSRGLRVVGFALLGLFLDPKAGGQPVSRSIQDYVLNQGAFQVPLHAGAPSTSGPLRVSSLDDTPRLPCASLLVRILTPDAAKLQRRRPPPRYSERVYDTVSRATPSSLERKLYGKVLGRRPLGVREAARLVAWFRRQPGGLTGRRLTSSSKRSTSSAAPAAAATGGPAAAAASGGSSGGLLSRVFGGGTDDEAAAAATAINTGDPAAAIQEQQADLEEAKAERLPPSDPETMDWMADVMEEAAAAAGGGGGGGGGAAAGPVLSFINYNTGYEYCPELGFFVALDGAARLSRLLPTAGLVSYSPPGSLYQDHPLVDDVKVTLDYDLEAPLAAPRWLDGYQQFADVSYQPGLVLILDVRAVVPGSSSSAPVGWACLPVFEPAGRYVASGTYQLPLFQGIPSHQLLSELAAQGDPDETMAAAIRSGRVRPSLECASVLVRLMCGSRQGQLEAPGWSLPLPELRLPRYAVSELGPRFVADMRKMIKNKTYSQAKPKALTDEQWMDQINDTLIKVAGLDDNMDGGDSGDEAEGAGGAVAAPATNTTGSEVQLRGGNAAAADP